MARICWFLSALLSVVLFSSTYTQAQDWKAVSKQIHTYPRSIHTGVDWVVVMGRWKTTVNKTAYPKLAAVNAIHIFCSKQLRTCQEATANLYTPADEPKDTSGASLHVLVTDYKILDWSGDTIRAKYEASVADIELKISLKDRVAERSFRETIARGSDTADPNVFQSWILE